jgi:DNA polymerase
MTLADLHQQILQCTLCPLAANRKHAVPGTGPNNALIMVIGEKIGSFEDERGLPFVGKSGAYLDATFKRNHLDRAEMFLTNVTKCRVKDNEDPTPDEIDICTRTYLFDQINLVRPRLILLIGRYATNLFVPGKITDIHGLPRKLHHRIYLPIIHPAAALRVPSLAPLFESDIAKVPALLLRARLLSPDPVNPPTAPSTQLSLL